MRLWTTLCILIALVADVSAVVLLLAGHDEATILVAIGSGAVATAGASVLIIITPRPTAEVVAQFLVPSPLVSPESPVPLSTAPEPPGAEAPPAPLSAASEPPGAEAPNGEPLDNRPWLKLVEESVALFDELDRHRVDFDPPRLEVADHVVCRLQEILERCGVEPISGLGAFDRNRHQPEGAARVLPGATVTKTLSPGFRVGKRILRRARVCVQNSAASAPPS
jgi:hypothetical protein